MPENTAKYCLVDPLLQCLKKMLVYAIAISQRSPLKPPLQMRGIIESRTPNHLAWAVATPSEEDSNHSSHIFNVKLAGDTSVLLAPTPRDDPFYSESSVPSSLVVTLSLVSAPSSLIWVWPRLKQRSPSARRINLLQLNLTQ